MTFLYWRIYFLEKFSQLYQKPIKKISPDAMDRLVSYHWPGNVRELEIRNLDWNLDCFYQLTNTMGMPYTMMIMEFV